MKERLKMRAEGQGSRRSRGLQESANLLALFGGVDAGARLDRERERVGGSGSAGASRCKCQSVPSGNQKRMGRGLRREGAAQERTFLAEPTALNCNCAAALGCAALKRDRTVL